MTPLKQDKHELWWIEEDALFQACGLIVAAAHIGKTVFITWNENYLLNYRFKRTKDNSKVKITSVRIPLPNKGGSYLKSVHALRYNTILLMSNGEVYCFVSFKAVHLIKWLSEVRCLAIVGQGFSVIRRQEQRMLLQTYLDIPGIENGESTLQHTFDITYYAENIFQCDWNDDKYTLTSLKVSENEEHFVQSLLGTNAIKYNYIHIFSINGHVFAMAHRLSGVSETVGQDYHIELICVYATNVRFIQILPNENLCLVFLDSGSVGMWYVSSVLKIKQSQIHQTGSQWLDYDTSDNGDIYYTDGKQLVRLRFKYNIQIDECIVHTLRMAVPGVQVCSWLYHREELVCLSDNNIFYCIALSEEKAAGRFSRTDLIPAAIDPLQYNATALHLSKMQPALLQKNFQMEYKKQQLVSVSKNIHRFSLAFKMYMEYHCHVPSCDGDVVHLQPTQSQGLHADCIFAVLNVILVDSQPLFSSSYWKLLTFFDHHVHVYLLPTEILVKKKCRMVIPIRKRKNQLLPRFKLQLVGFIEVDSQINAVFFPISAEKCESTYRAVFSVSPAVRNLRPNDLPSCKKLCGPTIRQDIRLASHLTLSRISALFRVADCVTHNFLELYFVDEKLTFRGTTNVGEIDLTGILESEDASAIYYFKQHIILNAEILNLPSATLENASTLNKILKFQCESERLYGAQSKDVLDYETISEGCLKSKYNAIRTVIT
ncbi:uncharacterized protein LOC108140508 isoform X1 [Drosophila elegans]|uniref:uncharacterized protein LOC108140508 isoform X1 n=1 Tax=Drosophila elegans TaxID=30023 RepID=UPI001BC83599|nr:uncharacterized protein LOC108140508 isoform X1 [Drosophila elegans]